MIRLLVTLSLGLVVIFFSQCQEERDLLYPTNAIRFSQDFLLAIKTEQPHQKFIDTLEIIDLDRLDQELNSTEKKLAFWINTYNALVQASLRKDPSAYEDRNFFFSKKQVEIGYTNMSLDEIENGILRKEIEGDNATFLERFTLDKFDPRIHFTLNCGATSCPPIAYYSDENIYEQLKIAEESFIIGNSKYTPETNTLELSELFKWYERDFGGRSGIYSLMEKQKVIPPLTKPTLHYIEYNWEIDLENF